MTAWGEREVPAFTGKVVVITGGNGGLGLESARVLARAGAHVVIAARDQEKAARATTLIQTLVPSASLSLVRLDLGSQQSVRAAAAEILSRHQRVDVLLNNAGIMAPPAATTEEGIELQFGTNHVGHFLLTARLFPALTAAPGARVVTVTSGARHLSTSPHELGDVHLRRYNPWLAYARSKLANLYFSVELDRRCRAAGVPVASLVAHPGVAHTDLQPRAVRAHRGGFGPTLCDGISKHVGMSAGRGALPQLRAACDPHASSGDLYTPRFVTAGAPVRRPLFARSVDPRRGTMLWALSEELIGESFRVPAAAQ